MKQGLILLVFSLLRAGADEQVPGPAPKWQTLLTHSPFGEHPPAATPDSESPLEYRGFCVEDGIYYFCLYQPSTKISYWLKPYETKNQTTISRYDEVTDTVYAQYGGRMVAIPIKQARVALTNVAENSNTSQNPAASGGGEVSEDEVGRLQQVAEEIRRRRALRQAGKTQDIAQGKQVP